MTWKDIKTRGSVHYKKSPDEAEPIDLYRAGGMIRDFAICSIIKYAYRNRRVMIQKINPNDIDKIIHYAEMLKVVAEEEDATDNPDDRVPK